MRASDPYYRPRYVSILKNVPNMMLRPARLSQNEIDAAYASADILLLPYDPDTYALRGSAVYQEGIAMGRPVVCSEGLGMSDLVVRYGNGLLANNDNDFAEKTLKLASRSKREIEAMTASAREAYERDFSKGLEKVIAELLA
jgi:glycosyltransferase involved in cell wall biosynthesis